MAIETAEFVSKYGPWALVTGSAEGLGASFAEELAKLQLNLLLLDKQQETLETTAEKLRQQYAVEVKTQVVDLSDTNYLDKALAAIGGQEIGLFVSNAAFGQVGPFADTAIDMHLKSIQVNITAPMQITYMLGRKMLERGRGGVILIASDAAYHGTPFVGQYSATKAYNLVLGEALWYEWGKQGVDVLSFAPGPTNTPGLRRSNPKLKENKKVKGVMLPADTARAALSALGKKASARPSLRTAIDTFIMSRLLNRGAAVRILGEKISSNLKSTLHLKTQD
ncbi:SDR family NAD(P)-dependent oxidoreductase [Halieaceae bacterium IMCC8485]|uniref:SDR family NAD(P)-dependent oxidoreductase n=1 Tax=Candidatus Seongchinamella marina TaxID=2518990 RepID=A0ABT3SZJ3_9GAMM|nr:SDR family NAD(P)-dependent oxidoreductase [Candidatus Seongchinamella marina]MCX2975415.1 SDR family NAD(P)-dependent oxidoreductase [Candidatus Seongchinamella marina]